ncbi:MAG: AraC family transcriptional regulator ligand-binding domain-containing protein, partial [Myxococcota bacterium]
MPDAAPPPGRTHASGIFGVATYAVAKGIEREEVESVLGVSLHQLMDPKLWLPDHIPTTLCSTVLRARPDDAVPIELGMVFPVNDVIHAMQMAPTLADALRVFARFSVVAMANDAEVHFDNSPNFGAIHWFHPADKLDGGIMQGAVVAFLLRVIRGMTSSAPSVAEVRLSGDRVGLLPHYERYFGRAPRFHTPSPRGELVFPKADLERPLERGDAKLFALFWDLLETRLELISNLNPDPVEELRRRFADAVREGIPRIQHRDLHPRNVFLGADGRLRVLDFGLSALGS